VLELGLGAREALSVPGTGTVIGAYTKAAYVRVPGGLFALTTRDVASGPLHARTDLPVARLGVGDRVVVTPRLLQAGPLLFDLRAATVWRGGLPQVGPPGHAGTAGRGVDVPGLARRLGGAGPGLTPAGDDALAGVLLVARLHGGQPAEEGLVGIAAAVPTNDISRAFLVWAARGQSTEPVHQFLLTGDPHHLGAVRAMGHTSGAALADGLLYALHAFARPVQQDVAGCGVPAEPRGGPAWPGRFSLSAPPLSARAGSPPPPQPTTTAWSG
jgi:hypothetical protein